MKSNGKCVVGVFIKNGDCYQVALDEAKQEMVLDFIQQIQGGIKIIKNKLPIIYPKKLN